MVYLFLWVPENVHVVWRTMWTDLWKLASYQLSKLFIGGSISDE